jgi:hypothetical protein
MGKVSEGTTAMNPDHLPSIQKVYYRPIEAAIRWCGLERHEPEIIRAMIGKLVPQASDFPQWPSLRLNAERIFDAIANHELPFGIDGVTVQSGFRLDHPNLTIRHIDLRAWMKRYYPHERPLFLFDPNESVELSPQALQTLIREKEELNGLLERREAELQQLRAPNAMPTRTARPVERTDSTSLTMRAEATYLHIVGVMLKLLLGQTPTGQRLPHFATQEAVVSAMVDHFGNELMGITERTLHAKFAAANRKLEGRLR